MPKPTKQSGEAGTAFALPAPELRQKRDRKFLVALTADEAARIEAVAESRGETASSAIRTLAVAAADFELARKGKR